MVTCCLHCFSLFFFFFFFALCCSLAINVVVDHLNPGVNSNQFYNKISVKESRWFLYH